MFATASAVVFLGLTFCVAHAYEYGEDSDNNQYSNNFYEDKTSSNPGGDSGRVRRFGENTLRTLNPKEIDDVKGAIQQLLSGHEENPFQPHQSTLKPKQQSMILSQMPHHITGVLELTRSTYPSLYKFEEAPSVTEVFDAEQMSQDAEVYGTKWTLSYNTIPRRSSKLIPSRSTEHALASGPARSSHSAFQRSKSDVIYLPERSTINEPQRFTMHVPRRAEPFGKPMIIDSMLYQPGWFFPLNDSEFFDPFIPKPLPTKPTIHFRVNTDEPVEKSTTEADESTVSITTDPDETSYTTRDEDTSNEYEPSSTVPETSTTEVWIFTEEQDSTSSVLTSDTETTYLHESPLMVNHDVDSLNENLNKKSKNSMDYVKDMLRKESSKGEEDTAAPRWSGWQKTVYDDDDNLRQGEKTTTSTRVTTPTTTTTTTTPEPRFNIDKFLEIIANLTYDYETNLTQQVNESLKIWSYPTCGPTVAPSTIPWDYGINRTIISKCFVCGLKTEGIPYNANCADAFAGDFLPLVPQDPRAKRQLARYKKYCRYGEFLNYWENATQPRTVYGRWTGGCSVRWTDITGIYTQRTCRNRKRAVTGLHYASKRMAKLEMTLANVDNGCIVSPVSTLLPLSRGISLFARFHACVCMGNWCNAAVWVAPPPAPCDLATLLIVLVTAWKD